MNATRLLTFVPFALALSAAACSSSPPSPAPERDLGETREDVIGGKASDKSQDAVVLVFFYDPSTGLAGSCTGTLLAPNLVLTARHCVADTDEAAACDTKGNPIGGSGSVYGTRPASQMMIFKGATRPNFDALTSPDQLKPDGLGAKILDDGSDFLCNHDIGIIILKAPIAGASIAPIRLDSPPKVGETFTAVGWGVTDSTAEPTTRQQRAGISIEDVGPVMTQYGPIAPNEFQVGESICQGDSGGPALAKTGAVIGVVSRGGNGQGPSQSDPSAGCIGAQNIYTKTAPFKALLLKAYGLANAEPWYEGGVDPRKLKVDSACTAASDCRSNLCAADPSKSDGSQTCAQDCSDGSACPDGETCQTIDSAQICRAPAASGNGASPGSSSSSSGGCSGSPASPSSGLLAFALATLGVVFARRRR